MKLEPLSSHLVDLIYSAALGEATWEDFLGSACRLFDDGKAILFYHDAKAERGRFLITKGFDRPEIESYSGYYSSLNCWMQKAKRRPVGIASHTSKLVPKEQLFGTEFYNDFLRPVKIGSGFGLTIARESEYYFMLSILGEDLDANEIECGLRVVQSLVPHLERVAQFYRRGNCGLLVAGAGAETALDCLSVGLVRVGVGQRVTYMNATAEALLDRSNIMSVDPKGRLKCQDAEMLQVLNTMTSCWPDFGAAIGPKSFILDSHEAVPFRVTLVPPPRDEVINFFRGPECTLLIETPRLDVKVPITALAQNCKLSRAETSIVEGLTSGSSINDIAFLRGVSPETVRNQLKGVFAKTGFHSQSDLIRHLTSLASAETCVTTGLRPCSLKTY